jgi:hypothetical protein
MSEEVSSHAIVTVLWVQAAIVIGMLLGMIAWYRWKGWARILMRMRRTGDAKAVADTTNLKPKAILMPPDYLRPVKRKLIDLTIGESANIEFTDVVVDESGATFVDLDAKIAEEPNVMTVRVRLGKDSCTLILPKRNH